jgi:hypothetical protein
MMRLTVLVPAESGIKKIKIVRIFLIGQLVNSFAPARAGDFLKLMSLANKENTNHLTLAQAAGVLLSDKIIDILSLFTLCLLAGVEVASQSVALPKWLPYLMVGLALAIATALCFRIIRIKIVQGFNQVSEH